MRAPIFVVATVMSMQAACGAEPRPSSTAQGSSPDGQYVLRVDRQLDREEQPDLPTSALPAEGYRALPPTDRWNVSIGGSRVVIVPGDQPSDLGLTRIEGRETRSATAGERYFEITSGVPAGGRFTVRGEEAELTIFGSGVPVVSSERGRLITR
jgi:hypothetical protein